eukprot:TRINITY_DN49325_c0_g1_i1.p1 TRINITY_DN49325_c0_g1~~TRINITY_DN49325_c0_g1_i1.p1  ORF type:complete len:168 (-),score=33.80 TRINITY_DN49325_c0_g1_i1:79-582(-)
MLHHARSLCVRHLHIGRVLFRAKTPLEMMADELREGLVASQVGGIDHGVAAVQELSAFERIAEQRIKEAQESGALSNLKGSGKPLRDDRPDLSDAEALGAKLLKDANVLPPWMEEQQALQKEITRLDQAAVDGSDVSELVTRVNDRIRTFNRRCPPRFQKPLWTRGH